MKKLAVVYWSGTGNTEAMANAVVEGMQEAGAEASLFTSADFNADMVRNFDGIAFGCPSMGDEVLEEEEFEPMYTSVEKHLGGKPIALFGSYGWGDGQWMREWSDRADGVGANQVCEFVIVNEEPDEEGLNQCKALGAALAN